MKAAYVAIALFCVGVTHAQPTLVINELQAANHATIIEEGRTPDWIEIYNPAGTPIDMVGMRIAIAGRQHVIDAPLSVPAKAHLLLWCDGHPERGVDHLGFTLSREGGTALLIAADGITILDLFTWPALSGDLSMGRTPDGARVWSFFQAPTPGRSNGKIDPGRTRIATPIADRAPGVYRDPFVLNLSAQEGAEIRYTLDGSAPAPTHGERYTHALHIDANIIVRARAFAAGRLPSEEWNGTYVISDHVPQGLAITAARADLWSDSTGIYVDGAQANHTRKGVIWERNATLQFLGDTVPGEPIGLRISGSGSRGFPKRSFKVYARDRYGSDQGFTFSDGTQVHEGMLRADATPHAFLRNMLMEELVRRHGLNLEVQPSVPMPLYLNAAYWGVYRWMPAKDAEWLEQRSGAEALDVLEGPAAVALSGKNDHFLRAQELLMRGAPLDSIDALMDTRSLIDLACLDLYTGRADHDLNVRCYRPRQQGGRWRWVLFDMDLWSLPEENSVERMCAAAAPETPYIPQLLRHPALQLRMLARITALQATAFDPSQAGAILDSLYRVHEPELLADFRRWELELECPSPSASLGAMHHFVVARPERLFDHLAERTRRKVRMVTVEAPPAEQGVLLLEGLALAPGSHELRCFSGVAMQLEARAAGGHEFSGWKGVDAETAHATADLSRAKRVKAYFREVLP